MRCVGTPKTRRVAAGLLLMSYATSEEYYNRTGADATAIEEETLEDVLTTASRQLDRRLGWCPGGLGPIPSRTRTFWPGRRPDRILRLRDVEGQMWPLRSWTEIRLDFSGTGTADQTLDGTVSWVVGQPEDGPYRMLRLLEAHADATATVFPSDPGMVTITGSYGHTQVVPAARELVVHVAHTYLDSHSGGASAMVEVFEQTVRVDNRAGRAWRELEMEFSAGRMGRLGMVSSAAGRRW